MSLVCSSLSFQYGRDRVVDNVSFQVEKGSFCTVLGRNGSGKTTLLHCLAGILRPAFGRVELEGLDLSRASRIETARRVSLVPQEHTDIFPFQVIDVVVMGRTPFLGPGSRPGPDDYSRAWDTLATLQAGYLGERNFNKISGGERRIALLARALLQSRDTVLLDEPTTHLDFHNTYRLLGRIKDLCKDRSIRAVAAMHDPNLAFLFADQVVMLKDGRLLAEGPPEKVMTAKGVSQLYGTETRLEELPDGQRLFLPAFLQGRGKEGGESS